MKFHLDFSYPNPKATPVPHASGTPKRWIVSLRPIACGALNNRLMPAAASASHSLFRMIGEVFIYSMTLLYLNGLVGTPSVSDNESDLFLFKGALVPLSFTSISVEEVEDDDDPPEAR